MQNYRIKEISISERPMEKFLSLGVDHLSDVELLAILIGSGTKEKNAIMIAEDILRYNRDGFYLLHSNLERLMNMKGIGLSKASRILAGLELGRRLSKNEKIGQISISSPQSIANFLFDHFRHTYKEEFCAILLDTKNKVIGVETISIGTINSSVVHPRESFRSAIMKNANAIIFSHNHPSGDPYPSQEDIKITKVLCDAGEIVGIKVLDHIIIGNNKFVSLKEKRLVRGL